MTENQSSYERLQKHLDGLPVGFPKSESGIEIAILRKIFDPEEAEMAAKVQVGPETVEAFGQRVGMEYQKAEEWLERMASKGQIFRMKKDGNTRYNAVPFLPGIWEYQLGKVDHELAEMMEKYFDQGLGKVLSAGNIPLFRILPVEENIPVGMEIMPYQKVKELIRSQSTIALADCICRKEKRLTGQKCDHIDDVCLVFSHGARYYVEKGFARFITTEEAIEVLDRSEKDGLVHSPVNAQHPMGLCNCCGCCCGILRGITQHHLPVSKVVRSDFYCVSDTEVCCSCEQCIERCQVKAIQMQDNVAIVDRSQCIGCGLCVSTCPMGALRLVQSPADTLSPPPVTTSALFMQLAAEKSRLRALQKSTTIG